VKFLDVNRIGHGLSVLIDFERYHMKYSIIKFDTFHYFLHILWLFHLCFNYSSEFLEFKPQVDKAIYSFLERIGGYKDKEYNKEFKNFIKKFLNNPYYLDKFYGSLGFSEYLYKNAITKSGILWRLLLSTIKENYGDITFARKSFWFMKEFIKLITTYRDLEKETFTVAPLLPPEIMNYEKQILFIKEISKFLRDLIKKKNIVLEICPSSNIILYNIRSFKDHPIFANINNNNDVKFAVNTDNPMLLNTNIILEHLLLYEASNYECIEEINNTWESFKFT